MKNLEENFQYDSQNRVFPATAQSVTYTGFDKADKVKQGNDSICYAYGYDRHFTAKFRLKLKKVEKTTRPFRYDLNQIPYDYTLLSCLTLCYLMDCSLPVSYQQKIGLKIY